jgi:hypothetical protein
VPVLFCIRGVCLCSQACGNSLFLCVVTCAMSCELSRFFVFGDLPQVSLESGLVTSDWTIDNNWSEQNATLQAPDGESTISLLKRFRNKGLLKPVPTGDGEGILAKTAKLKRPSSWVPLPDGDAQTPKAAKRSLPTGAPPSTAEKVAPPPRPPMGRGSVCG